MQGQGVADWTVVQRETSPDGRRPVMFHVAEAQGSRTLCGHGCTTMDGWQSLTDWHPEDVDALDRCGPCFTTLESRKRHERGTEAWRGQFQLTPA